MRCCSRNPPIPVFRGIGAVPGNRHEGGPSESSESPWPRIRTLPVPTPKIEHMYGKLKEKVVNMEAREGEWLGLRGEYLGIE